VLSPLWILRDAALNESSNSSAKQQQQQQQQQQCYYTSSYLEVLQTLLAVDQAHLQDLGTTTTTTTSSSADLCSASIVGLSALSSWCSMAKISSPLTIAAIVDAMNDLCHVVERAAFQRNSDHDEENNHSNNNNNLTQSLIPILEVLSGITYGEAIASTTIPASTGTAISQALLNSGLMRQLLQLALENNESSSQRPQQQQQQQQHYFHHALWSLCVAYPKTVGKYVSRYPGTAQLVRIYNVHASSSSRDCVQSILWHAHGYLQCDDEHASTPRVVWKTTSASQKTTQQPPPLSKDECREVCQKAWTQLCRIVQTSILVVGDDSFPSSSPTTTTTPTTTTAKDHPPIQAALEVLSEWERLLALMVIPSMALSFSPSHWMDLQSLQEISTVVVRSTTTTTTTTPSLPPPSETSECEEEEKPTDSTEKKKPSNHQMVVAKTRKLVKQYTLLFQGNDVRGTSSKTD
jgi:hypothetical protein